MPTDTTGSSFTENVPISSTTPTRAGYVFNGWCTVAPENGSCSGTTYAAGSNWSINQTTTSNTIHLFAMWREPKSIANADYMQEVEACPSTLTTGQVYTIKDKRDEIQYRVAKLADEKCWMLDNLALDLTNSNIVNALSADNTNIDKDNETAILTSLKSGNRSAGNQYATGGITNWTSSYSYSVPMVNITNKDVIPQSDSDLLKAETLAGGWKVGGYYNYCAASAGSYCYGSDTSQGNSSGNATSSICPKGWRMPTSNGGETNALYSAYSSASEDQYVAFRKALLLSLSGYFYNGSVLNQGDYGYRWSSTRNSSNFMYTLFANMSGIYPANYDGRHYGYSLRCVLGS